MISLLAVARAAAHDPVIYLPPEPQQTHIQSPRLEHLYRLFSDLCLRCPTESQRETLARAEDIYQVVWAWRPKPPEDEEVRQVTQKAESHYRQLRDTYPAIRVLWEAEHLHTEVPLRPILLARGIERGALLEVENRMQQPITIAPRMDGQTAPASPPLTIPPGERRTFILPLQTSEKESRRIVVLLEPQASGATARSIEIPVETQEPARIQGVALESRTGKPSPGRVRVLCSDGQLRHALAYADNTTVSEKPVVFRPASYKLPFFYSDGTFEIIVPPGETQVTLERGFEHRLLSRSLDLKPGEVRKITLSSGRFLDMARKGWVSGDTHVHWVKNSWDINEALSLLGVVQRAEDVRVINNLTLYQYRPAEMGGVFIKPDHHPMGPVPGMCDREYHVQMGEEYRNDNHYGHINLLGISSLIQPIATGPGSGGPPEAIDYPINRTAILEARRQGGINIEAHNLGPFFTSDVPVNVALGLSDSLDQLEPQHYYRFLNSGFHIGLTNGSDHPARVVGCVRCYVRVEGAFTYAKWLDGVRQGRTFTTSGPLLFLTVNGKDLGDTLDIPAGTTLKIRAKAVSRFPLGAFELVSNGEVLKSVKTEKTEALIEMELIAGESRWFCVRASRNGNYDALSGPDIAHTAAIYVRVDGKETLRREAIQFWIENIQRHMARIRQIANFANDDQRQEALAHVQEGLAKYQALLQKAEK
jgi:hypothetical protein